MNPMNILDLISTYGYFQLPPESLFPPFFIIFDIAGKCHAGRGF